MITVDESLLKQLRRHSEVNWSEVARDAFVARLEQLEQGWTKQDQTLASLKSLEREMEILRSNMLTMQSQIASLLKRTSRKRR